MIHQFPRLPDDSLSFWRALHPHPRQGFFLGPVTGVGSDVYMSAAEPRRFWTANSKNVSALLKKMARSFHAGASVPRYFGFLGFNAGRSFDSGLRRLPLKPHPLKTPAAAFGDYPFVIKLDFNKQQTILYAGGSARRNQKIKRYVERLLLIPAPLPDGPVCSLPRKLSYPRLAYFSRMVRRAKEAITRGDIYQANLSLRFKGPFAGSPEDFYRALSCANPSPYSCLLKCGPFWLVSSSPELLVRVEGASVVTRPIAGTRPRGKSPRSDKKRQGQLLLSPKERAEHVMLVDLERNDLGRVCEPGTVKVTHRYQVERYSHVMHIVSQVEGRLLSACGSLDVLQAVFPGGTITGCPKIKSIEYIEAIEGVARGPFYGSAGFFSSNGDATFNILIRTALLRDRKIYIQAGAGIVADSQPRREYREIMAKAGALLEAVSSVPGDAKRSPRP